MEMILYFKDNDHDEICKFNRAISADKAYVALFEITQIFRNTLKHSDLNDVAYRIWDEISDKVWEVINDNIDMDLCL